MFARLVIPSTKSINTMLDAMNKPLNPRQMKFVALLCAGLSAVEAYVASGYKAKGASARAAAGQLLANINVQAAIKKARDTANVNNGITADWFARCVRTEAERTGPGSSHAGRVAALKLAAELLGTKSENSPAGSAVGGKALGNLSDSELKTLDTLLGKTSVSDRIGLYTAAFENCVDRETREYPTEQDAP